MYPSYNAGANVSYASAARLARYDLASESVRSNKKLLRPLIWQSRRKQARQILPSQVAGGRRHESSLIMCETKAILSCQMALRDLSLALGRLL